MIARATHQASIFLSTFILCVAGWPTFSNDNEPSLAKAKADFSRALDELTEDLAKWKAIADAKAEIDRLFVHRSLFSNVSSNCVVPLEKCVLGICQANHQPVYAEVNSTSQSACACVHENDIGYALGIKELKMKGFSIEDVGSLTRRDSRRSNAFEPLSKDTNSTYVPPPNTDITPRLFNQSLTVQPQDTATVVFINPDFRGGHISFGVKLNDIMASTGELNASTDLPCDSFGSKPAPNLELRPKDVDNGAAQVVVPDCTIVAVKMYNPNTINYWVQNKNGSLFSLAGSTKVVSINQLNPTASVSVVLRAKSAGSQGRDLGVDGSGSGGKSIARRALEKKRFSAADSHTATMLLKAVPP